MRSRNKDGAGEPAERQAPRVRIVHETNPSKYFPALLRLAADGRIEVVGLYRSSVVKEFLRSWVRERRSFSVRCQNAARDLWFRAQIPWIRDETIVLGFAPWDWRLIIYSWLSMRNRVVYHTSWIDWERDAVVPRRYGFVTPLFRMLWARFLRADAVNVVSVLPDSVESLERFMGVRGVAIPHAVPEEFFDAGRRREPGPTEGVRLVFVGELAAKKGVRRLLQMLPEFRDCGAELTVIGDGPLRSEVERSSHEDGLTYLGVIGGREELAAELARHDVMLLLSQRTADWEELFGMVIVEAAACGCGVIASRHIGPEKLLAALRLGNLFDDGDDIGPIRLVRRLARDRAELDRFRSAHIGAASHCAVGEVAELWASALGVEHDMATSKAETTP